MAKAMRRVNPNHFTWASLVAAFVGGWAFYSSSPANLGLLWLAWGMVLANSVLDLLDGKVAKLTGRQTAKGDYLDHAIDRFSDALFLGGISLSPWVDVRIGLAAIVFTLLTSYLGTQAQAIGMGRNYGGLLGRADRMVLLLVVPVAQIVASKAWNYDVAVVGPVELSLLGWMMAYVAVVGALTTVQRFVTSLGGFDEDGNVEQE